MRRETVDDFEDPRLDDYRNLKDAQLAASRNRFIVEGRANLLVLLARGRFEPASILLSERAWSALEPELEALAPDCPIQVAPQTLLDRIVGFPIHRGCLAACERGESLDPMGLARDALSGGSPARIVVLEGLSNHDNVGGIFRNAMALGAGAVLLCPRTCDPLYRKAIRTSMGGSLCVPFARASDLPGMLDGLKGLGIMILALDPGEEGSEIGTFRSSRFGPLALLLGAEGAGLSAEALALADLRVRIGMEPGVDSLNVATAAGIALHALRGGVEEAAPMDESRLDAAGKEGA